ncbi:MAG: hypothetical protein ACI8WB_002516 [Phenylobacterium sp.]|jgi:hypothetical protein
MSPHRHRNTANKVYLPSNSRYNQYLLAEFKITDELLALFADKDNADKLKPWQGFYQKLSELFFTECEQAGIENVHFIANDKLPRVRFSQELRCWETEQQMLVFYNPSYHQSYKSHFDGSKRAQKVSLLFLSTGEDIRLNAAGYHHQVRQMLHKLLPAAGIPLEAVRLRDHQHLTYDLFARQKGTEATHGHTLRKIENRYKASDIALPEKHDTISYVVASFPLTRRLLKRVDIDLNSETPYAALYAMLGDAVTKAATHHNLLNGAFIADRSAPIIRNSDKKLEQNVGELRMLGYDPLAPRNQFICRHQDDQLVDYAQIIFSATEKNIDNNGYGKFMETVDKALRLTAKTLDMTPEREEFNVRFHQHLAYHIGN